MSRNKRTYITYKKFVESDLNKIHNNGIYYIRHLKKPDIYYIGSTYRNCKKYCKKGMYGRWVEHISQLRNETHHNPYLLAVYNKYGSEGLRFGIVEICNNKDKILNLEEKYIEKYNSFNNGYNLTPHADRVEISDKLKQEYSKRMKENNPMYDPQNVKSMIETRKELDIGVNVLQYSKDGKFIKEYSSIKKASNKVDVDSSNINKAVNGEAKTSAGYIWIRKSKFTNNVLKKKIKKANTRKKLSKETKQKIGNSQKIKVKKYNLDNELLNEYNSIKQAGIKNNIDPSNISRCANGNQKTCGGFIWKKE